jgi:hypothetical protein
MIMAVFWIIVLIFIAILNALDAFCNNVFNMILESYSNRKV